VAAFGLALLVHPSADRQHIFPQVLHELLIVLSKLDFFALLDEPGQLVLAVDGMFVSVSPSITFGPPRCGSDLLLQSGQPLSAVLSLSPTLGLDSLEGLAEQTMPDLLHLPVANDGPTGAVELNVAAGCQGRAGRLLELGPVVTAIAVAISGVKGGAVQVVHDEGTKCVASWGRSAWAPYKTNFGKCLTPLWLTAGWKRAEVDIPFTRTPRCKSTFTCLWIG
jgi:hypothetical protein